MKGPVLMQKKRSERSVPGWGDRGELAARQTTRDTAIPCGLTWIHSFG